MRVTLPERIVADHHAAAVLQMDVDLHVAQDIAGDRDVPLADEHRHDCRSTGRGRILAESGEGLLCWSVQPVMATSPVP